MTGCIQRGTFRRICLLLLFLLPLTALSIHVFGFRRIYSLVSRLAAFTSKGAAPPVQSMSTAQRMAQAVTLANRHLSFYQASCLAESLLLWGILKMYRIDARLVLGVRTITGPLDAHAWVSYRNTVLNDIPSVQRIYAAFDLGLHIPGESSK